MIENITEYNNDILKQFISFSTKKAKIITYICSAIILSCSIFQFISKDYVIGVLFLLLSIGFVFANIYMVKFSYKKSTTMPKIKNHYEFLPESLNITTYSQDKEIGKTTLSYISIKNIKEINNLMFLYINKNQAIIVDCLNFKDPSDKEIVKRYIQNVQNQIIKK